MRVSRREAATQKRNAGPTKGSAFARRERGSRNGPHRLNKKRTILENGEVHSDRKVRRRKKKVATQRAKKKKKGENDEVFTAWGQPLKI